MAKSLTKVDIWNRALGRIHENDKVQSETETTPQAEACDLAYDDCLVQLLEMYPWPFATRQVNLAKPAGVTRTGWECVYTLPADFVRPMALLAEDQRIGLWTQGTKYPFDTVDSDDGESRYLVTDLDNDDDDFEVLEYIGLHEHVPSMPRLFVDALIWLLASELSASLKKDTKLADYCLARFDHASQVAATAALAGRVEDFEQDSPTILARQ